MLISAIFLGIVIFMFLVLIHEYGHFRASRWFGVKVEEFGIGIPPKAFNLGEDEGGTMYTANLIPLGGFVRLKGEDPNNETDFLAPDSFITAPFIGKLVILVAGIVVNTLFAWFAFSIAFWQGVTPINILPDSTTRTMSTSYLMPSYAFLLQEGIITGNQVPSNVIISDIFPDSRATKAGLKTGDHIVSLDNISINTENVGTVLQTLIGKTVNVVYIRGKKQATTTISCGTEECFLGIGLANNPGTEIKLPIIKFGLLGAIRAGAHEIIVETKLTFSSLGKLAKGLLSFNKEKISTSAKGISGPVGIVKMIEVVFLQGGRRQLLAFAGMISLALAVFNILPIPALDGGRALGVIIQAIGRRKPSSYFIIESYFNMFFFVLMILVGIWVILKDLVMFRNVSIPFIGS